MTSVVPRPDFDAEYAAFSEETYQTAERSLRAGPWDRDLIQDALQEAYIQGRMYWPKIREYRRPVGWIIKAARIKILKQNQPRRLELPVGPEELRPMPQPDHVREWEAEEMVLFWLRQLPARLAMVFWMSLEGFSNEEIGRILDLADNSVRSYKASAKRRLRKLAESAGYAESDSCRRGGKHGSR